MAFVRKIKRGEHTYLAEVENVWEGGKVRQKHIRYVGKEVDGQTVLSGSIENARIEKVTVHGPLLILDAVAKQMNLGRLLGEHGEYLLSLAYAHCIAPDSVRKLTEWFGRTDIHSMLSIPDVTYKRLLEALDSVQGEYGVFVQSRIFNALKEQLGLQPQGFFYDVTSIYFYAVKCPLAKRKKKPKSRDQPQIQVGLAVTKEEGIPIFHRVFEGNIFDGKTLPDLLVSFREHDVRKAFLVWDRGVSSGLNISDARAAGFQVLCGLPLKGDVKKVAEETLSEKKLNSIEYRVRLRNATFYAVKTKYTCQGNKGYLVVCVNEKMRQDIRERRYDEIDQARAGEKKSKQGVRKYLRGRSIDYTALKKAEKFDGVSTIFCTRNLTPEEIIRSYFEKDRIEKAFRTLKGLLEADKIRFWLTGKVKAHIFVCYLSYLLLSLLEHKLRKLDVSASNALEAMESMYKVHITDPKTKNKFTKTVILSKQQEEILKNIDKQLIKPSVHK